MTCINGNCETSTNQNRGHFIVKCSNEQCNYTTEPKPVDIDLWNISQEYRNQVDNCPKCNSILYLTPQPKTGA